MLLGERSDTSYRAVAEQVDASVGISTDWIKPERRIGIAPLTVPFLERRTVERSVARFFAEHAVLPSLALAVVVEVVSWSHHTRPTDRRAGRRVADAVAPITPTARSSLNQQPATDRAICWLTAAGRVYSSMSRRVRHMPDRKSRIGHAPDGVEVGPLLVDVEGGDLVSQPWIRLAKWICDSAPNSTPSQRYPRLVAEITGVIRTTHRE